jgi:hypothetical protein
MKSVPSVMLLLLLVAPHLEGQGVAGGADPRHEPPARTFWVTGGLGVGGGLSRDLDASTGPAALASGTLQTGGHLLSTRVLGTVGVQEEGLAFWEVGALYGRSLGRRTFRGAASGGLGLLGGESWPAWGAEPEDLRTRLGIPLELQASWRPTRVVAGALILFGHVGRDHRVGGAVLAVQVGRMWN